VPESGAQLLAGIPRLGEVARMIRYHAKGYDGSGSPDDGVRGEALPMGARILKVLHDFTELELKRMSRRVSLEELALHEARYDRRVLQALYAQFGTPAATRVPGERRCAVEDLGEGMVLAHSLATRTGRVVLCAGVRLGPAHLMLLRDVADILDVQEPVVVMDQD